MKTSMHFLFASLFLISGILGCGSSTAGKGTVTPNFVAASNSRALISKEVLSNPFDRWVAPTLHSNSRTTAQVGQTTAAGLTSLQYYIQSIQLCEDITTSGSGYSGTTNCIELYSNADAMETSVYDNYAITEASADSDPNHFIDFLTDEGRAKLEVSTSVNAGTYNYALINFMRPIKIKAEFKDPAGTTLHRTKSGGTIVDLGVDDGGRQMEAVKPANTHTGSAEVMTYMLNNGGTWFPMLKPFVIAAGDNVLVDFAFNPDNFATSTEIASPCSGPSASGPSVWDEANCVTFDMPYAKMSPVPRIAGEQTKKEVYLISDYTTGASTSDFRIELYYNSADTEKAIRGVDGAVVMKTGATESAGNIIQTYRVAQTGDVVTFYGYNSTTGSMDAVTLTDLTRRTNSTLTINCIYSGGPCGSVGTTTTRNYTYVGDVTLED